ncbi:MAG: hypothetical protein LBH95_04170 [Oscillospiraceae bacterium]|nr:hypothetical protein [Oscillospiraceae bacterium]
MPDEPGTNETDEMDEIDKFLSTLPSLSISKDMVNDPDAPVPLRKTQKPELLPGVFILLAWVVAVFAALTILRASPQSGTFFNSLLDRSPISFWDKSLLFAAMCYMLGNCAVCAGGLAICFVKKIKATSGSALNLWIAGGISAVTALVLVLYQ